MGRSSDSGKKTLRHDLGEQLPNPRLVRAMAKQRATLSQFRPVDTLNTNTINPDHLPAAQHPDRSKAPFQMPESKNKFVSFHLRSLFAALAEIHQAKASAALAFATVNLSVEASMKMINNKQPAATVYGKRLTGRFKNGMKWQQMHLIEQPDFFLVLEDSADRSLHAHIVISYHPEDEKAVRQMLRKEAAEHNNSVQIQTEYKLWLDAAPGSVEWELNELALEHDTIEGTSLCTYPLLGSNKHGQERFYRLMPVDAGAADYISKELEKPLQSDAASLRDCPGAQNGRRLYAQKRLVERASELYVEAYESWVQFEQGFDEYVCSYEDQRNHALEAQRAALQAEIDELHRAAWENERQQSAVENPQDGVSYAPPSGEELFEIYSEGSLEGDNEALRAILEVQGLDSSG